MDATRTNEGAPGATGAAVNRTSERELVVSRTISGPARIVFEAWTKPELFRQWWVPTSFPVSLRACELDVRVGGRYQLVFEHEGSTMEFFGRYLEVTPPSRLVWTNDEEAEAGPVTTVTFEEDGGNTRVVVHERYPSKEALDDAIASGSAGIEGMPEQLVQLEDVVARLGTNPPST